RSRQRGDPPRVQGEAAISVHAPVVPEDRVLSAERSNSGPRGLSAAEGSVSGYTSWSVCMYRSASRGLWIASPSARNDGPSASSLRGAQRRRNPDLCGTGAVALFG